MSVESEKVLEAKLRVDMEALGGYCWKLLTTHLIGIPDRIVLLPGGRIFFAEIKTTKQKPRKIQLLWHKRLRALGFVVYVIDTSEQINKIVEEYGQE